MELWSRLPLAVDAINESRWDNMQRIAEAEEGRQRGGVVIMLEVGDIGIVQAGPIGEFLLRQSSAEPRLPQFFPEHGAKLLENGPGSL